MPGIFMEIGSLTLTVNWKYKCPKLLKCPEKRKDKLKDLDHLILRLIKKL